MALLLLRNTLDSLGFAADEQRSLLKGTRDSLFSEMSGGKQLQTSLSKKYRANQTEIDCILSDSPPAELSALVSTLEGHQERFRSIATRLAASKPSGGLLAVAQSLLHMQVNRWLREQPRQKELVLFDFLLRWLNSQSARPSAS